MGRCERVEGIEIPGFSVFLEGPEGVGRNPEPLEGNGVVRGQGLPAAQSRQIPGGYLFGPIASRSTHEQLIRTDLCWPEGRMEGV
jgi:hypothetical protein